MFVPSESIFAEIHENFEAHGAAGAPRPHRHRLAVLLMLSIQVIQAISRTPACASRRI
jgi:DNA recombination protein RmuC